jgi:hypothetical protein
MRVGLSWSQLIGRENAVRICEQCSKKPCWVMIIWGYQVFERYTVIVIVFTLEW